MVSGPCGLRVNWLSASGPVVLYVCVRLNVSVDQLPSNLLSPHPQGVLTASSIVGTCGLAWSVGLPGRARMAVNAFAAMSLVQVGGAGQVGQVGWVDALVLDPLAVAACGIYWPGRLLMRRARMYSLECEGLQNCICSHSRLLCRWDWGLPPWSTLSPPLWLLATNPAPWPSSPWLSG